MVLVHRHLTALTVSTVALEQRLIVASGDATGSLWMVRLPYFPPSEWGLGFIQVPDTSCLLPRVSCL